MKKLVSLSLVIGLFLVSFVSAASFSLGDILESIDPSTMVLGALFIIFFGLINFALSRMLKGNTATAGVISLAVSLLIVWGINKSGFDYESLIYNVVPEDLVATLLPFILIIGAILLFWKFGKKTLGIIGIIFIVAGFSGLVYQSGTTFTIGAVLIIIWLIWEFMARKKYGMGYGSGDNSGSKNDYAEKTEALRQKQRYEYYKRLEEQKKEQQREQQRDIDRERRRKEEYDKKVKERYISRFGRLAWMKRKSD